MLLSRETDYALRILQNLMDGQRRSVGEISNSELIPQQFAYKIIRKLAKAGLIEITRGVEGGCKLMADLEQVSLYDLMAEMQENGPIMPHSIHASLSMSGKSHPVSANGAAVRTRAQNTRMKRARNGARAASASTAVCIG